MIWEREANLEKQVTLKLLLGVGTTSGWQMFSFLLKLLFIKIL